MTPDTIRYKDNIERNAPMNSASVSFMSHKCNESMGSCGSEAVLPHTFQL